jgi:LysR family transcriptional regulator, nod-box dependent transcriptional activator
MRYEKLDLNLLVALDALLQERNVSLASERLRLSQSATSNALGRLRYYFEDDLLVLKGRHMVLTPRGEELVEPVGAVLAQIKNTIAKVNPFVPAESDRTIVIQASDYTVEVLLHHAMVIFAAEAPNMRFEFWPMGDNLIEELQRGQADLLITLDTVISTEHPWVSLFSDGFVVVGWSENPFLTEEMTQEKYEKLGHVMVRFGKTRAPSFEEWALKSQSVTRRVEVVAPSFTSVPGFLIGSHRIATMHRRLAERLSRTLPLKIMEIPFEIPPISQAVQWAISNDKDPAIRWVVQRLQQISDEMDNKG